MICIKKITQQNRNCVFKLYQQIYSTNRNSVAFLELMTKPSHIGFSGYVNNKLICFISAYHVLDEIDIIELCVAQEMRRQNFGFELVSHLQRHCIQNEIEKIFLDVAKNNIAAIGLYEKAGFNKIRVRKNYYKLGSFSIDAYGYCWNMKI